MTIDSTTFGHLAICAIRYCHGRQTYMPSTIQGIVREHLAEISDRDLHVMIEDCKRMSDFDFGDEQIDKPNWIRYRQDLEAEQERRKREREHGKS